MLFVWDFRCEDIFELTKIDPWFLAEIEDIVAEESLLSEQSYTHLGEQAWRRAKRKGFSDARLAQLLITLINAGSKRS